MASPEQLAIDQSLGTVAPRAGVTLGGWVVMAEWVEPDGQKFLTRLVAQGTSPWQVKGYLHEGLYSRWPANPEHHNPGHPAVWADLGSGEA
jgi:hypothetical protein